MLLVLPSLLTMLIGPRLALLLQRLVIVPVQTMCLDTEHADDECDARAGCHKVIDVVYAFGCDSGNQEVILVQGQAATYSRRPERRPER